MCMKYVNVNVQCFETVSNNILGFGKTAFVSIIDTVKSKERDNKFYVNDFNVVTFVNIRGTKDAQNAVNPLDAKKKLQFRIRLTKLDEKGENQLSYDLKDFEIVLSDNELMHHASFDFIERIEITKVNSLILESKGLYAIKVLIKEPSDELFNVQMVHCLRVE